VRVNLSKLMSAIPWPNCEPLITPLEVRPNIGTAYTASLADEPRFDPRALRRQAAIGVELDVTTAMAID
jgi:hypothetical protein